jgi:recombination protein RecR
MSEYILPIEILIEQFRKLPGVGRKTAARYAMSVLNMSEQTVEDFSAALLSAKRDIFFCKNCGNLCEGELCEVCEDTERAPILCVVEDIRSLMSIEKVREYKGRYHVLHGALCPMKGIGPEKLNIGTLSERIEREGISEVIIATNPTVEGDATAMYLTRLLAPLGVRITRPALGIPVGGDIEYADELTLSRAIRGRNEIN